MHLNVSNKLKKKYNFSDDFLIGSILPDIYKKTIMTRDQSHFLKEVIVRKESKVSLPDLERFMEENKNNNKDEVVLGYLVHLVEDYIWFRDYSTVYVIYCGQDKNGKEHFRYKKENYKVLHGEKHFITRIYSDYSYYDNILSKEENLDLENIKKITSKYLKNDKKSIDVINESVIIHDMGNINKTYFITKKDMDNYIKKSLKMSEEILDKFMNK